MPSERSDMDRLDALKRLTEGLLRSAGRARVRGNLLELRHPEAPHFELALLHGAMRDNGVSISLSQHDGGGEDQRVRCRSEQLPFQDGAFHMVVLHHVIGTGAEPELAEAARVLAPNGLLLLLGLNRLGWRYRVQDGLVRLPGLAPLRVKARLDKLDMVLRGFAGAGLAGGQRPICMNDGLAGLAAPFADLVLLQAHHRDSPGVTPLRFSKPRSAVVQSAPMSG